MDCGTRQACSTCAPSHGRVIFSRDALALTRADCDKRNANGRRLDAQTESRRRADLLRSAWHGTGVIAQSRLFGDFANVARPDRSIVAPPPADPLGYARPRAVGLSGRSSRL